MSSFNLVSSNDNFQLIIFNKNFICVKWISQKPEAQTIVIVLQICFYLKNDSFFLKVIFNTLHLPLSSDLPVDALEMKLFVSASAQKKLLKFK